MVSAHKLSRVEKGFGFHVTNGVLYVTNGVFYRES